MTNQHQKHLRFSIFLLCSLLFVFTACDKDDDEPNNPYNGKTQVEFNPDLTYGTMVDQEGNEYKTIKIGNQTWMAENLRTTIFRNGDNVDKFSNSMWNAATALRSTYDNRSLPEHVATYGRLYNWYAVSDERSICPEGWRVPNLSDWKELRDYLIQNGYNSDPSISLGESLAKSLATTNLWASSNAEGSWSEHVIGSPHYNEFRNKSGFSAVPAGQLNHLFNGFSENTVWWCSNDDSTEKAYCCTLQYDGRNIGIGGIRYKTHGYSIRCVQED